MFLYMDRHYKINYSQCWEDPDVLIKAFKATEADEILSITSGGDNTLALALQGFKRIRAIDSNPAQNFLFELKLSAIKNLTYQDFLKFIGILPSAIRRKVFLKLKKDLSFDACRWWENNLLLIDRGIIHAGKFEKYLAFFRKNILPIIHSSKTIDELLSLKTIENQKKFYDEKWNTLTWRLMFKLFFNKILLKWFGRAPHSFSHNKIKDVASYYLQKTQYALTEISVANNYFLDFILTGTYSNHYNRPPYLKLESFYQLKRVIGKIEIITSDVGDFLVRQPPNSFSRFNLSDIFETMSEDSKDHLFKELIRTGRNNSIIVYWNNLVERDFPIFFNNYISTDRKATILLHQNDRAFFYNKLIINRIKK